ncbi:MAG TPA: MFS transporter [Chloroflexota bacterium]
MPDLLKLATVDITPLRHRDFKLLFWGQLISFLGSMLTYVAVPYQVYQLTHSPLMVGLLGLAQLGPILAFSMVGGAIADASDRRGTVLATEVAFAVLSALLYVNAILPEPQLWVIFVLAAIQAGLFALQRPSLDALMPRLVEKSDLTAAGALTATRGTIGQLLGPAIGGVLIVTVGLPATYAVDAISFAASLVALAFMRASPPVLGGERPSLQGILDGWNFARSRSELIGTYVVDIVAMVFGMPEALFPAIAETLGGPAVLGLLYSAPALGALIAAGTSGWTNHVQRQGLAVILAATAWGVAIIGFGLATTALVALPMLAVAGGADAISGIFRMSIWNRTVPDELRGRLASIEMVSYTSGPALGDAESGLVAGLFSVPASIISGGVLCVLGCIVCALLLPGFRQYEVSESQVAEVASRALVHELTSDS